LVNSPVASYLVIGHVCLDHTPYGEKWGGTALFGAITALRLGATVHILTAMPADAVRLALPDDVIVHNVETATPLTFRHEYVSGKRELYVTATAPTLHRADLPRDWTAFDIVHLGPVAQEVGADLFSAFDGPLLGGSVQGWMRNWDQGGHVRPLPASTLLQWAPPVDFSFLSEEDIGGQREIVDFYRQHHRIVVLTDGAHGATVYEGGATVQVPAVPVTEVDANGAGDVFAAAFLIRFHETRDAIVAAQFAAAVASFHVEQIGISGIPTRAQAESRWRDFYGS
jgi:1D-myo-inositol 3-kinase